MAYRINKAAVIGSGVMGAGIAAHLANVGIPVYMFDIVPQSLTEEEQQKGLTLEDRAVRNRIAEENRQKLLKQKPSPLFDKRRIDLITACNLEDDLDKLKEVDWIVEVVVERLDVKREVLAKIEPYRKENAIVSTNTSGISVEAMSEGRSEEFRRHFLGTHFFNPPRYLKLLEVIPTAKTDSEVVQFMKDFGEKVLGKGVVLAKDTPNFIANRIGCYGLMVTVEEMMKGGYSVGEVDSVTGPVIGRPKSATFRTLDVVGLDTFAHVAHNVRENVSDPAEQEVFRLPDFMAQMVEKGWIGAKAGQGFFKKVKGDNGSEILELDYNTMEYVPRKKLNAPSVQQSKSKKDLAEKLRTIVYAKDRAGELVWNIMKRVLLYSADKLGEIADDIVSIDRAMKWGFGWEMGPFETWDAIGLEKSVARMEQEGEKVPEWIKTMLAKGQTSFYNREQGKTFYISHGEYKQVEKRPEEISLAALKEQGKVIKKNAGASLIDIGDGVALLEFHSPNNAIGADIIHMLHFSLEEVARNYEGLVIGNQGKNFCVGANLMLLLMEAQEMNWPEIDFMVRQFQQATTAIRYSEKPVVVAPFAMTLGGGTEFCLPAARIQAAAETYMGLVEVGVGLIPGGGGNKEMLYRLYDSVPDKADVDLQQLVNLAFETIAMAKVSTSAEEARQYQFIRPQDGISINQSFLLYEAKQKVLELARAGYRPPQPKKIPVVGREGKAVLMLGAYTFKKGGQISDHDYKIAEKLAHVLSGGDLPQGTLVDEQYLLDIEREAFLSLCGEPKTQQRMQYMLTKGKPLRN
ncbi:3-hydroxyacyl-CoA dehydrogenase NAD-binding protein [Caldalkalibacillus thermarum TA2.A1]|uniref:3-hydroxyacyl-CoA dehydrogenase NAD-binding protein n=1 Tax=Caldalkalibacillus thermarum (strain TA2.A1) TaxID=986075 RepID=F5LB10_CALTT|nr:3-hydroxyacyl-CoA dehydrogenase/enoyl-CoA hydratase family protein [Caldalkalibacillus thermarum]EGL81549.1 3-hydroxyacyl-CoA dehydrogenase NAD-binding protein [Caldalkalibacillus thermarum TA2.A1]